MGEVSERFSVAVRHAAGSTTVEVGGDIDLAVAGDLRQRLDAVIEASSGPVEVDLSMVTFLDSSGVVVLLGAAQRIGERDRQLTLRSPSRSAQRVLEVSGVLDAFSMQPRVLTSIDD